MATECLYVKEVDPGYSEEFPGFEAFADYDFTTRPASVRREIRKFENSGRVTRPLISVHGTLDALIPLRGPARPSRAMIEAQGLGANYRLYEVQNGNHLEAFKGTSPGAQLPNLELIQPHAHRVFELLEALGRGGDSGAAEPVHPTGRHDHGRTGGERVLGSPRSMRAPVRGDRGASRSQPREGRPGRPRERGREP